MTNEMNIYTLFYSLYNPRNRWVGDMYLRYKQIIAKNEKEAVAILERIEDPYDELELVIKN